MERSKKNKHYNNYNKNNHKKPIYYGIHLEIETEKKLLESLQNSINLILSEHKEDFNSIYETISELIKRYDEAKKGNENNNKSNVMIEVNKMKYPKSFHITLAFGGKKGFDKNSEAVQEFEPGLDVDIRILGLVVVPNKMVIVPVDGNFKSDNKFPHFTTFIGDLKPVQSNEILENIFDKGKEMEDDYNKILNAKIEECFKKIKVKIEGEEFDGFVYLTLKYDDLKGRMKEYFY